MWLGDIIPSSGKEQNLPVLGLQEDSGDNYNYFDNYYQKEITIPSLMFPWGVRSVEHKGWWYWDHSSCCHQEDSNVFPKSFSVWPGVYFYNAIQLSRCTRPYCIFFFNFQSVAWSYILRIFILPLLDFFYCVCVCLYVNIYE